MKAIVSWHRGPHTAVISKIVEKKRPRYFIIFFWATDLRSLNLSDVVEMNCEFERETGFINSRPSLAECLTSFPPVGDAFQSSSIKNSTLSHSTLIPPPFEQTIPSLTPSSHPRHSRPKQSLAGVCPLPAASLPPEYPWMKEKKASKKNPATSAATAHDTGPLYFSPQGSARESVFEGKPGLGGLKMGIFILGCACVFRSCQPVGWGWNSLLVCRDILFSCLHGALSVTACMVCCLKSLVAGHLSPGRRLNFPRASGRSCSGA